MKRASDYGSTQVPYPPTDDYKKRRFLMRQAQQNYGLVDPYSQMQNQLAVYGKYCHPSTQLAYYGQLMNMFSSLGNVYMNMGNEIDVHNRDYTNDVYTTVRTVYIGDLSENTTYSDIADQIHVGVIERMKLLPEKNCVFITFLDGRAAQLFTAQALQEGLRINGREVKIGQGRPSILTPSTLAAIESNATRTVFLGNIGPEFIEEYLRKEFSNFGVIESLQIVPEKKIAFIHMTCISSAKKAIDTLSNLPQWSNIRINYGKDRCDSLKPDYKKYDGHNIPYDRNGFDTMMNFKNMFITNRTVYIGNIHPDITTKDLCDVIRCGNLQNIKYFKDKNIAFATFINPLNALQFYTWANANLVLKGKKLKLGWGNPSALPNYICEAVKRGASRNVYVGNIDETITEDKLRKDFFEFGDIELINIVPEKNIGFVNFVDIASAIKAIEAMKSSPEYSKFKISFGKDRCRNPTRHYNKDSRLQNYNNNPKTNKQRNMIQIDETANPVNSNQMAIDKPTNEETQEISTINEQNDSAYQIQ